jgi:RNA polymerase sigma factor FliA
MGETIMHLQLAERRSRYPVRKKPAYRDQLVNEYLPYVKRIVQRIATHLPASVDVEDLMNVGVIGLIQAVDRYDPRRDNKFMTYAIFRIKGAVLSELRSRDFLSRSSRRKLRELEHASQRLEQGIGLDELHRTKQVSSISFISFEDLGISSKDEKEKLISYLMDQEDDALSQTRLKELKTGLARAIEQLPEKERLVISLYYLDELTMKETGEVLNITESRVSQIHSQAIVRLRNKLRKERLLDETG